jgi:hypothetical protein
MPATQANPKSCQQSSLHLAHNGTLNFLLVQTIDDFLNFLPRLQDLLLPPSWSHHKCPLDLYKQNSRMIWLSERVKDEGWE